MKLKNRIQGSADITQVKKHMHAAANKALRQQLYFKKSKQDIENSIGVKWKQYGKLPSTQEQKDRKQYTKIRRNINNAMQKSDA